MAKSISADYSSTICSHTSSGKYSAEAIHNNIAKHFDHQYKDLVAQRKAALKGFKKSKATIKKFMLQPMPEGMFAQEARKLYGRDDNLAEDAILSVRPTDLLWNKKRTWSISIIQGLWRMRQAKRRVREQLVNKVWYNAAVHIQQNCRKYLAHQHTKYLRRGKAALMIQLMYKHKCANYKIRHCLFRMVHDKDWDVLQGIKPCEGSVHINASYIFIPRLLRHACLTRHHHKGGGQARLKESVKTLLQGRRMFLAKAVMANKQKKKNEGGLANFLSGTSNLGNQIVQTEVKLGPSTLLGVVMKVTLKGLSGLLESLMKRYKREQQDMSTHQREGEPGNSPGEGGATTAEPTGAYGEDIDDALLPYFDDALKRTDQKGQVHLFSADCAKLISKALNDVLGQITTLAESWGADVLDIRGTGPSIILLWPCTRPVNGCFPPSASIDERHSPVVKAVHCAVQLHRAVANISSIDLGGTYKPDSPPPDDDDKEKSNGGEDEDEEEPKWPRDDDDDDDDDAPKQHKRRKRPLPVNLGLTIALGFGDVKLDHVGGVCERWEALYSGSAFANAMIAEREAYRAGVLNPGDTVMESEAWIAIRDVASGERLVTFRESKLNERRLMKLAKHAGGWRRSTRSGSTLMHRARTSPTPSDCSGRQSPVGEAGSASRSGSPPPKLVESRRMSRRLSGARQSRRMSRRLSGLVTAHRHQPSWPHRVIKLVQIEAAATSVLKAQTLPDPAQLSMPQTVAVIKRYYPAAVRHKVERRATRVQAMLRHLGEQVIVPNTPGSKPSEQNSGGPNKFDGAPSERLVNEFDELKRRSKPSKRRKSMERQSSCIDDDGDAVDNSHEAVQKRALKALKANWGDDSNQLGIWKRRLGGASAAGVNSRLRELMDGLHEYDAQMYELYELRQVTMLYVRLYGLHEHCLPTQRFSRHFHFDENGDRIDYKKWSRALMSLSKRAQQAVYDNEGSLVDAVMLESESVSANIDGPMNAPADAKGHLGMVVMRFAFGLPPLTHTDDPMRGVAAARLLITQLEQHRTQLRREAHIGLGRTASKGAKTNNAKNNGKAKSDTLLDRSFGFGAAVTTGGVFYGTVGTASRQKTVIRASGMESYICNHIRKGQVICDHNTMSMATEYNYTHANAHDSDLSNASAAARATADAATADAAKAAEPSESGEGSEAESGEDSDSDSDDEQMGATIRTAGRRGSRRKTIIDPTHQRPALYKCVRRKEGRAPQTGGLGGALALGGAFPGEGGAGALVGLHGRRSSNRNFFPKTVLSKQLITVGQLLQHLLHDTRGGTILITGKRGTGKAILRGEIHKQAGQFGACLMTTATAKMQRKGSVVTTKSSLQMRQASSFAKTTGSTVDSGGNELEVIGWMRHDSEAWLCDMPEWNDVASQVVSHVDHHMRQSKLRVTPATLAAALRDLLPPQLNPYWPLLQGMFDVTAHLEKEVHADTKDELRLLLVEHNVDYKKPAHMLGNSYKTADLDIELSLLDALWWDLKHETCKLKLLQEPGLAKTSKLVREDTSVTVVITKQTDPSNPNSYTDSGDQRRSSQAEMNDGEGPADKNGVGTKRVLVELFQQHADGTMIERMKLVGAFVRGDEHWLETAYRSLQSELQIDKHDIHITPGTEAFVEEDAYKPEYGMACRVHRYMVEATVRGLPNGDRFVRENSMEGEHDSMGVAAMRLACRDDWEEVEAKKRAAVRAAASPEELAERPPWLRGGDTSEEDDEEISNCGDSSDYSEEYSESEEGSEGGGMEGEAMAAEGDAMIRKSTSRKLGKLGKTALRSHWAWFARSAWYDIPELSAVLIKMHDILKQRRRENQEHAARKAATKTAEAVVTGSSKGKRGSFSGKRGKSDEKAAATAAAASAAAKTAAVQPPSVSVISELFMMSRKQQTALRIQALVEMVGGLVDLVGATIITMHLRSGSSMAGVPHMSANSWRLVQELTDLAARRAKGGRKVSERDGGSMSGSGSNNGQVNALVFALIGRSAEYVETFKRLRASTARQGTAIHVRAAATFPLI
jgi:hypothetical protein